MCTIVLAWKVFPSAPVCVASVRDEADDRPFTPPKVWDRDPKIVAPQDTRAGGTWLGYNTEGVLVAVTNRWTDTTVAAGQSRGQLVLDALRAATAEAAVTRAEKRLEDASYRPCHLLCVDQQDGIVLVHNDPEAGTPYRHALTRGISVLVNVGVDGVWTVPETRQTQALQQRKQARALAQAVESIETQSPAAWLRIVGNYLGDHAYGRCHHDPAFSSRSTSLIQGTATPTWQFAAGPPCKTAYDPVGATVQTPWPTAER